MEVSQSLLAGMYLTAFICGGALGLLYDSVRFIHLLAGGKYDRKTGKPDRKQNIAVKILIHIWDFVFMLICTCVLILICYIMNKGRVRISVIITFTAGYILYRVTLGKLVLRLLSAISESIRKVIGRIIKWMKKKKKQKENLPEKPAKRVRKKSSARSGEPEKSA